jgi:hypothetical protein
MARSPGVREPVPTPTDRTNPSRLRLCSALIQFAALAVLFFGITLIIAPSAGEWIFNRVYYGQPVRPADVSGPALEYIRFANGIIGAVMIGWMICIIMIARGPFMSADPYAWKLIALPLAVWFLVDTGFSITHGIWGNVALNAAVGLMFGIPRLLSHRHFDGAS